MENASGFMLVNKPGGITSHDVVQKLRIITGIKKIGHAGTLDPIATGLLITGVGRRATKKISTFAELDKEYEAEIFLGAKTDTYDKEGRIIHVDTSYKCKEKEIRDTLFSFVGRLEQVPPMYSAKKVKGMKLYEMAREGVEIERDPINIRIYDIDLLGINENTIEIKVRCSTGTYIRSLAYDIGEDLGCGAYLQNLKRTAIGGYELKRAVALKDINKDNWEDFLF
jgi:tRNA pseudouridine55 synthase